MRVGQHPQAGAIPAQDLDPRMTPVAEHKERPAARILAQLFAHQPVQAVEAFAQIARFHGHKHLQAAGKTQHGLASERNRSAASAAC